MKLTFNKFIAVNNWLGILESFVSKTRKFGSAAPTYIRLLMESFVALEENVLGIFDEYK